MRIKYQFYGLLSLQKLPLFRGHTKFVWEVTQLINDPYSMD